MTALPALQSGAGVGFTLGLIRGGGSILATPLLFDVVGMSQPHLAIVREHWRSRPMPR